jgi:hypothetical protein
LEEAGDRLFTFTRLPPSQWRSVRTTNAIKQLYEEFKRRIKTQTVLPSADTAAMLFWALLACGQINMRKVDAGKRSPHRSSISQLTSQFDPIPSIVRRLRRTKFQPIPGRHLVPAAQASERRAAWRRTSAKLFSCFNLPFSPSRLSM